LNTAAADIRARAELVKEAKTATSSTGILPADAEVKVDKDSPANMNVDVGSREASTAPTSISDASQPEVDVARPSELLAQDNTTTLTLPDRPNPALDTASPSAQEVHAQLTLPTAPSAFGFSPMHADAPDLSTLTQPLLSHADPDTTPAHAREVDPSSRFSMPPSTPTPSIGSEWSFAYADGAMGYNTMSDAYANPMSQYVAGSQPIYRTYSHIAVF
jgi:hypothetical protein